MNFKKILAVFQDFLKRILLRFDADGLFGVLIGSGFSEWRSDNRFSAVGCFNSSYNGLIIFSNKILKIGLRRKQVEKQRMTITIETEEIWTIKRRRFFVRSFCKQCNREVSMIPPDEAALLACRDLNAIYSFMEKNCFHLSYFNDAKPLICLNSLCSI